MARYVASSISEERLWSIWMGCGGGCGCFSLALRGRKMDATFLGGLALVVVVAGVVADDVNVDGTKGSESSDTVGRISIKMHPVSMRVVRMNV